MNSTRSFSLYLTPVSIRRHIETHARNLLIQKIVSVMSSAQQVDNYKKSLAGNRLILSKFLQLTSVRSKAQAMVAINKTFERKKV